MIAGIPYFGVKHNDIADKAINSCILHEKHFDSLYIMVKTFMYRRVIVIIDNKWFSWLNDIKFNYRDKECYIPYYTYKIHTDDSKCRRSDNNGHLILKGCAIDVRYEYKYCKFIINLDEELSLILYDIDTGEKFKVHTNKWIASEKLSLCKLHELYLDSCYTENDFMYNWAGEIYHKIKSKDNKEQKLREELGLEDYSSDTIADEKEYRDVRKYRYEEVVSKVGFRNSTDLSRLRRLKFESYLYCSLRQHCTPEEDEYLPEWEALGKTKDYIKIGEGIKLIIKSYWLDKYRPIKKRSWSRV